MRIANRQLLSCFLICLLSLAVHGQRRRDPLNPLEIDQIRDTALEPEERLKLFVKFARARLDALEQIRSDPKAEDRVDQTRARLQDFLDIYDELNNNVDNFADRGSDLRKPLKFVIEADTEFQSRLRALKDSAGITAADRERFSFLLDSAIQTVDDSAKDHRQLLTEVEQSFKDKPKRKAQN